MTEKEKAKAYDEAIERAKKWYNIPNPIYCNIITEKIFPELKESEDEEIRKEIISILRNAYWTSNRNRFNKLVAWLEKQDKKSSWKPSKEEMDALYSLSYITNEYDEHKEDAITHLYQDLKREFFSDSSYENMFSLDNKEDDVRRRSTIQVLEYARSLDAYNQYGKADIDKNIAWLEKQGDKDKLIQELGEYKVKYTQEVLEKYITSMSNKDDERLRKTTIAFLKDFAEQGYENAVECIDWLEKQGKNSTDKIEPRFKVGDWVIFTTSRNLYQVEKKENYEYTLKNIHGGSFCIYFFNEELIREWTIQDAKDGDIIHLGTVIAIFKKYIGREKCICYCSFCKDGGFEIPIENGEDNIYGCYNATPATKEQRDALMKAMNDAGYEWDAEKKKLNKKSKFDPKTLQPFDKVLARDSEVDTWECELLSRTDESLIHKFKCCGLVSYIYCIPYNDDTKHLVGTTNEAPEYYRYWED